MQSLESSEYRPPVALPKNEGVSHTGGGKADVSQPLEKESITISKAVISQPQPSQQSQSQPLFQLGEYLPRNKFAAPSNLGEVSTENAAVKEVDGDSHQSPTIIESIANNDRQNSPSVMIEKSRSSMEIVNVTISTKDSNQGLAVDESVVSQKVVKITTDSELVGPDQEVKAAKDSHSTTFKPPVSASFDDSAPTDLSNIKNVVEKVVNDDSSGSSSNFQFVIPTTGSVVESSNTITTVSPKSSRTSIPQETMVIGKPIVKQPTAVVTQIDSEKFYESVTEGSLH